MHCDDAAVRPAFYARHAAISKHGRGCSAAACEGIHFIRLAFVRCCPSRVILTDGPKETKNEAGGADVALGCLRYHSALHCLDTTQDAALTRWTRRIIWPCARLQHRATTSESGCRPWVYALALLALSRHDGRCGPNTTDGRSGLASSRHDGRCGLNTMDPGACVR